MQKKNAIGIMQGRLSPQWRGRYQAFPSDCWQAEFHVARELGFDYVEFILDYGTEASNPLLREGGLDQIARAVLATGVDVRAICADYFMDAPLHSAAQAKSEKTLEILVRNAAAIGAQDVVIPCVDHSSLRSQADVDKLSSSIDRILPLAERLGVNLAFETDLAPDAFRAFLDRFPSPRATVNYDVGNSASLGYSVEEEFDAYGPRISDVHIKDRVLKGGSVKLGTGNADFAAVFSRLARLGFSGNLTMQAARADRFVADLALVAEQLAFARSLVDRYLRRPPAPLEGPRA